MQIYGWAGMAPVTTPKPISTNPGQTKYAIENCLPQFFHQARTAPQSTKLHPYPECSFVVTAPYPSMNTFDGSRTRSATRTQEHAHVTVRTVQPVAPQLDRTIVLKNQESVPGTPAVQTKSRPLVAKLGKKIADCVKQVGHHRSHSSSNSMKDRSTST